MVYSGDAGKLRELLVKNARVTDRGQKCVPITIGIVSFIELVEKFDGLRSK